jgi:uracil-DNA glycosylase
MGKGDGASAGAGAAPVAAGAGAGAAIDSTGAAALLPAQTALLSKYGAGGVHDSWKPFLATEMAKPYFAKLHAFVTAARAKSAVFPPPDRVFSAFSLTPFDSIKVVILGQDPYHGAGQAEGLSFSVPRGIAIPPSLRNILIELATDVGTKKPSHGHLAHWATQGVFLLNAVLTVESGKANSHAAAGWETFTTEVIREISRRRAGVVFMLWGKPAQVKGASVDRSKHLVLEAPHPSPLSAHRGFLGCKHFSQANAYLVKNGVAPIDWSLNSA